MAKFHGPTNLHLGGDEPWASSEWDPETGSYALEVTGDDLKKFRPLAEEYGFAEDSKADKSN